MGKYYRCVYIPMPNVIGGRALKKLMQTDSTEYGVVEGVKYTTNLYFEHDLKRREIVSAGENLVSRFAAKEGGGHPALIWHNPPDQPLFDIRTRDYPTVLYVHCHGIPQVIGFRPLTLNPIQLAKRLQSDGLPKAGSSDLKIKLWSCNSATQPDRGKSFLEQFVTKMGQLGYYDVEVFGYLGSVNVDPPEDLDGHKGVKINDEWIRARDGRVSKTTRSK